MARSQREFEFFFLNVNKGMEGLESPSGDNPENQRSEAVQELSKNNLFYVSVYFVLQHCAPRGDAMEYSASGHGSKLIGPSASKYSTKLKSGKNCLDIGCKKK